LRKRTAIKVRLEASPQKVTDDPPYRKGMDPTDRQRTIIEPLFQEKRVEPTELPARPVRHPRGTPV
jgi:hypothetical protein